MTIDVARARAETSGCERVVHLNNAGAALPPDAVVDAVIDHLRLEARIGAYEAADRAAEQIAGTYHSIAGLLGCRPGEVALVDSATRAWDMAFYAMHFEPGDRILTARAEYTSNAIAFLQVARRTGAIVEVIDDDEHGQLDVVRLADRLDADVKLVAVTHVPTSGGLVNPAAAIGRLTREAGIPFLLDACQSVGQMPIEVDALGCDMLSATGRKFLRGPRGTGFLYVSERLVEQLEPPLLDMRAATWTAPEAYVMRADAGRFETWEANYAIRIGLGTAVDYARSVGLDLIEARVVELARQLRCRLAERPGIAVHDRGQRQCGIVTFTVDGLPAEVVERRLRALGINTSVSVAAQSQFDLIKRGLPDLVRASVHYYNTEDELDRLVTALDSLSS